MKVTEKEVAQTFSGESAKAEQLVNSLLRSIGRKVGLGASDVDWDRRISVGDGGRDLIVHADLSHDGEAFLPQKKSYWSVKSGKDGLSKPTFRAEIRDHEQIQKWLVDGNTFVWCSLHDSTSDERQAIKDDVATLVDEFSGSFDAEQFEFRWIEEIAEAINLNPGVIFRHMPDFAARFEHLVSLDEWSRNDPRQTDWVNFADREVIVSQIIDHFNSTGEANVLHIAGLSGIGKTRAVREACQRYSDQYAVDVLYCESYTELESRRHNLFRLFHADPRNALLVFDEVALEKCSDLDGQLASLHKSVRAVTICPSRRQPYTGNRQNICVMSEPADAGEVYEVIKQNGLGLREELLRSVAARSAHDLRLALLLLKAVKDDPAGPQEIVGGVGAILDRILNLARLNDDDRAHLRRLYEAASCFVDIGIGGSVKNEIESIKEYFALTSENVRRSAPLAYRYGLSAPSKSERYFEATPHALATMVFAEHCWDRIADDLDEFYSALPDRLRKRFVDRCNDCTGEIRERVVAQLSHYFLGLLRDFSIEELEKTAAAKVVKSWVELDPVKGLAWLAGLCEKTSIDELINFSGDSATGDYKGRRYVVWLCESLARFPEYFYQCERILFRLALAENEPRIGNNATKIWKNQFWSTLSQSAVSLEDRSRVILQRVATSSGKERELSIECGFEVLEAKSVGMIIPPAIVSGRLAPAPWRARTAEELRDLRVSFAKKFLQLRCSFSKDEQEFFDIQLSQRLMPFVWLDLLSDVRAAVGNPTNETVSANLVSGIRWCAGAISHERYGEKGQATAQELRNWEEEIAPKELNERVRYWISQNPWDVGIESEENPYAKLAVDLLAEASLLNVFVPQFSEPRFIEGTLALAKECGKRDESKELSDRVRNWISKGESSIFVAGYLIGLQGQSGLGSEWRSHLDESATHHPEYTANVTIYVDVSEIGFRRLMRIVDSGYEEPSRIFAQLGYGGWLHSTTPEMQIEICKRLQIETASDDSYAASTALDLLYMWKLVDEKQLPATLHEFALHFLNKLAGGHVGYDAHKWMDVAESLVETHPETIAEFVLRLIVDRGGRATTETEQLDAILAKCAAHVPSEVMQQLGKMLLSREQAAFFSLHRHEGLFESVGIDRLIQWLDDHGLNHLPDIASHLTSPSVDDAGNVQISSVLQWVFTEHEMNQEVFNGFLRGRSRVEVWWGDEKTKGVRERMEPFLDHELRRVREWAAWEIELADNMQDWCDEVDEKMEREL
ncbi:ATP-binding protein [Novipirellula rosea]|uniref:AAA+ ATPase domain-containing protein n=1 Tax=Novipirellula rosea TaxID=1031540 RepID=A0ABP8N3E1_9BACT